MPLRYFASQDAIPEELRETAIALADGKFAVLEEPAPIEPDAATRMMLRDERAARKTAERERKEAEANLAREREAFDRGISPEELQRIRDDAAAARRPIEDERDRLAAENRRIRTTDGLRALALKHGVMADRIDDAMLILEKRTEPDDAGGIVVLDKAGTPTAEPIDIFLAKTFKAENRWYYSINPIALQGDSEPPRPRREVPAVDAERSAASAAARRAAVLAGF